jgi:hypothetical protein
MMCVRSIHLQLKERTYMAEVTNAPSGQADGRQSEMLGDNGFAAPGAAIPSDGGKRDAFPETMKPPASEAAAIAEDGSPGDPDVGATPRPKKKAEKKPRQGGRGRKDKGKATVSGASESQADDGLGAGFDGNAQGPQAAGPMATYLSGCTLNPAPPLPPGTLSEPLAAVCTDIVSASALLATAAAVLGPNPAICGAMGRDGGSLALRIGLVNRERVLSPRVMPALEAAYALERQDVVAWAEEQRQFDLLNSANTARYRLHRQTVASAALLGFELRHIPRPNLETESRGRPRPQLVLRDPLPTAFAKALSEATRQGLLLVDGRRLPTMAGFGVNYDVKTAKTLNQAAAGDHLELADPQVPGCVRPRPAHVSVIGVLSCVDILSLHKVGPEALAATVFIPAEDDSSTKAGAVEALTEVLCRVRMLASNMSDTVSRLRFSAAARKALLQMEAKISNSAGVLPPLADYYGAVPDLVRRVAIVLHLLDHASRKAETLALEISGEVAGRAIAYIEQAALPAARNVLAASSASDEIRDGRRLLSYAQWRCGLASPNLPKRDVTRVLANSMLPPAVDRAIARLVGEGLLEAANSGEGAGARTYRVQPVVFESGNELPDLITDARRANL